MARHKRKAQAAQEATTDTRLTALYVRVSTTKQVDEGNSLAAQKRQLETYCEMKGWDTADLVIYEDAGESAKTTDREAFQQMIEDACSGVVGRILVTKLDRLSRSTIDFVNTVERLDKCQCELVMLEPQIDTGTPSGKFMSQIFAALAEFERDMIAVRTQAGRKEKAYAGGYNGSRVPYGYSYDETTQTFSLIPDQAAVVERIFSERIAGSTLTSISDDLNKDTIPTQRGGKWYPATVKYILSNGIYAGIMQWDGIERDGNHEAIISPEVYEQAFTMDNRRKVQYGRLNEIEISQ